MIDPGAIVLVTDTFTVPTNISAMYVLAKSGGGAATVPAPQGDGIVLRFSAGRASTNTVVFTGATLRNGVDASATTVTLTDVLASGITVVSYSGLWYLRSAVNVVSYA